MERIEGQLADQVQLAKQVLSWITCAKRPLTTSELQHALAVEVGEPGLDEENLSQIEDMVSICAGLVTMDKESGIIRLVHYTTQEYFERTSKHWFPNAGAEITTCCITYLSFNAFESGFCETNEMFEERLRLNPFYDYAAHYWGVHARQMPTCPAIVINFLMDREKLKASGQGLFVVKDAWEPQYSQHAPKQVMGLHLAAYFGIEQAIDIMVQRGQSVEVKDENGQTPLWYAAGGGHETVVQQLLDKGADIEARDSGGETPLSWAVTREHETVVRLLLDKGADVETKDKLGITPLLLAAGRGYEAILRLLLERGASVETGDNPGITPLSFAAEQGHTTIVQLLLEKGADIETRDAVGMTPLSWAAEGGHEAVVRLLLDKGADVETEDSYGKTPLWYAPRKGGEAVVRLLLDKGADARARDNPGAIPMWYVWRIRDKVIERLRHSHATGKDA